MLSPTLTENTYLISIWRGAQSTPRMDKSYKDEGPGHAAALGKPADVKHATRTIEMVMGDSMRFEPKRIDIKQGETVRFVVRPAPHALGSPCPRRMSEQKHQ